MEHAESIQAADVAGDAGLVVSNQEGPHPKGEVVYLGRGEEQAYFSSISNVLVGAGGRTTDLQFNYEMPPQSARGKVRVWKGMTVDISQAPVYEASLISEKGLCKVSTTSTNFNHEAYTISVSVDEDLHSIAATATLLNGQKIASGGSFIAVTAKEQTSISTVFSNPTNLTAAQEKDWAVIYEGAVPGAGKRLANATAPLDETSGVINVYFGAGTLVSGKTYNVCLSVGPLVSTFSAAYVFKYLLL